jgi:hypothetical protein
MLRQDLGGVSRHVEDALTRPALQYLTSRSYSITLRHYHVDHEQVDPPTGEAQHVQSFDTRVGLEDPEALLGEDSVSDPSGNAFVVNNQDGRACRQEWSQRRPQG